MKTKNLKQILVFAGIGVLVGNCILFCLFALISLVVLHSNLSIDCIHPITIVFGGIEGLVSGYVAARMYHRKGLLIGLICGIVLSVIILITTIFNSGLLISASEFAKILIVCVSACFGGIFGVNSKY